MKKLGFTLAEVLIALSIVGIVAALTLPTFVSNSRNQSNATKLASTVTALENAFTSMIVGEAVPDLSETEFAEVAAPTMDLLGKYVKLTDRASTYQQAGYSSSTPFENIDGSLTWAPAVSVFYKMKNGALVLYYRDIKEQAFNSLVPVSSTLAHVAIDVTGAEGPNVWGRDLFIFRLGYDGRLYPSGSRAYNYLLTGNLGVQRPWEANSGLRCCNGACKSDGCTARLVENNYKVDY